MSTFASVSSWTVRGYLLSRSARHFGSFERQTCRTVRAIRTKLSGLHFLAVYMPLTVESIKQHRVMASRLMSTMKGSLIFDNQTARLMKNIYIYIYTWRLSAHSSFSDCQSVMSAIVCNERFVVLSSFIILSAIRSSNFECAVDYQDGGEFVGWVEYRTLRMNLPLATNSNTI